ncbi:MAG: porin family protein [Bacteroidaceae bacterium]|nr:porin family protein [Bacteroidaceae bacterium]MBO7588588.1 porin family protein [Bacteroidaceae bacterium]
MKKIMLVAAVLLTAGYASAQVSYQLGFMATAEEQTYTLGSLSTTHKNNYSGFMVGADYNMNIAGGFNVAPGVAMELSLDNKENDVKYKEFNILVPVDFNYGFNLGQDLKLYLFAGPTFDMGIMAKNDDKDMFDHGKKRFDILLGGGAWVDIKDVIRLKAGYKLGLLDISDMDSYEWKKNVFTVSVGYIF